MSKNIRLPKNDGTIVNLFGIEKISTRGDYTTWIPKDVVDNVREKTITQAGTYKAEDDGVFGYSKVNINLSFPTKGATADGVSYDIRQSSLGNVVLTVNK